MERQNVDAFTLVDRRKDNIQIGAGRDGGKIPIPYRHVEGGMLATHEVGDANAPALPEHEREQQQRHAVAVIGDDDERS